MADKPYGCGIGPALEVIGGKWKAAILRELESAGLVERRVLHVIPAHVEYSATPWGRSLNTALGSLADWGERYEQALQARGAASSPGTP